RSVPGDRHYNPCPVSMESNAWSPLPYHIRYSLSRSIGCIPLRIRVDPQFLSLTVRISATYTPLSGCSALEMIRPPRARRLVLPYCERATSIWHFYSTLL